MKKIFFIGLVSTKFKSLKSTLWPFFIKCSEITFGGEKLSYLLKNYNLKLNDFEPYLAPSLNLLNKKKIEQRYLGYYLK